jgi:hypothetical protein
VDLPISETIIVLFKAERLGEKWSSGSVDRIDVILYCSTFYSSNALQIFALQKFGGGGGN